MTDLFRREAEFFLPRDFLESWDRGDIDDEDLLAWVRDTIPTEDRWIMADGNKAWGHETYVPISQRLLTAYRIVRMVERRDARRDPWHTPRRPRKARSETSHTS